MDTKILAKTLREVIKTGKYALGYKEASRSVKGSKIVVASSSLDSPLLSKIDEICKESEVPLLMVDETSMSLAKLMGKPFRISVLSIKSQGDADLSMLLDSAKSRDESNAGIVLKNTG